MFVSFFNVFTRIRKVTVSCNCKGLCAICCRSFYVKPALFIELYLTLKTDFLCSSLFPVVLGFLPMTLLLNKFAHPCYRDFC